jgi:hypothetical protein
MDVAQMSSGSQGFDRDRWLENAPPQERRKIVSYLKKFEDTKEGYVKKIVSCKNVSFCEKALCAVDDLGLLESIHDLVVEVEENKAMVEANAAPVQGGTNYQVNGAAYGAVQAGADLGYTPTETIKWDTNKYKDILTKKGY